MLFVETETKTKPAPDTQGPEPIEPDDPQEGFGVALYLVVAGIIGLVILCKLIF